MFQQHYVTEMGGPEIVTKMLQFLGDRDLKDNHPSTEYKTFSGRIFQGLQKRVGWATGTTRLFSSA